MELNVNKKRSLLYVSYDGILEPLGRSQVLSYLKEMSVEFEINLITFEKTNDLSSDMLSEMEDYCLECGVNWIYMEYRSYLLIPAPIVNIVKGILRAMIVGLKYKCKVVHIRSYLPGLMVLPLMAITRAKLVFDIRGFWADEKVDRLGWKKNGASYRLIKWLEKKLLMKADYVVTLTEESSDILKKINDSVRYMVIPTCADGDLFKYINKKDDGKVVLGHLGAIDTAYDIAPVLLFFKELLKVVDSKIIFIYRGDRNNVYDVCKRLEVPLDKVQVRSALRSELPDVISDISIGCFFAKKNYSIKASMPTKIAEFLSCGKPIICNEFNKDVRGLIDGNKVGLVRDISDEETIAEVSVELVSFLCDDLVAERCTRLAESKLSLKEGVRKYRVIYNELF